MNKINLEEKFGLFTDHWSPKILGELNGQDVKIAKLKGDFVWHDHKDEDELFFVIKGILTVAFRDKTVVLHPGEMLIIPKGVEHKPSAAEEVHLLLFEPTGIKHTGEVNSPLTKTKFEKI